MDNKTENAPRDQRAEALALDLERVLQGELELALVLHDRAKYGETIDACLHGLQHFLADKDIRSSDMGYKTMQEAAMLRLISLLHAGVSPARLAEESFLN